MATNELPPPPPGNDALATIRNVTSTETELDARVAQFRATAKVALDQLARETEAVVQQARVAAEEARAALVVVAQREGDVEAKHILDQGAAQAATIRGKSASELAALKDPILSAVLAEFRGSGKR